MKIGNVEISSKLALAPMAGVTDAAFRTICREAGAGLTCSEMVSAKALCYGDQKSRQLLKKAEGETPFAVQIFGSDPVCIGEAAQMAVELSGADILDINMGCPVGKVVKSGDGSALMRDEELAGRVITQAVRCAGVPVTVKIRKGWDRGSANAVPFSLMAEECGVSAITVHGRTRVQMYSGVADWTVIRQVKEAVSVPVIANGDVFTGRDAERILECTGADMAMIGRGAFGNPWIFASAEAYLNDLPQPVTPSVSDRVDTAIRQFKMAAEYKSEKIACLEARKHFAWYLRGVPHSSGFKSRISQITTLAEAEEIGRDIKETYGNRAYTLY